MFQYECLQLNGEPIGYCFNSYLVGTCCLLPEKLRLPILEQQKQQASNLSTTPSAPTSPASIIVNTTSSSVPIVSLPNGPIQGTNTTNNTVLVTSHFVPNNNGELDLDEDETKNVNGSDVVKAVTKLPEYSSSFAGVSVIVNTTVSSPTLVIASQSPTWQVSPTLTTSTEKTSQTPSEQLEIDTKPSVSSEKPNLVSESVATTTLKTVGSSVWQTLYPSTSTSPELLGNATQSSTSQSNNWTMSPLTSVTPEESVTKAISVPTRLPVEVSSASSESTTNLPLNTGEADKPQANETIVSID